MAETTLGDYKKDTPPLFAVFKFNMTPNSVLRRTTVPLNIIIGNPHSFFTFYRISPKLLKNHYIFISVIIVIFNSRDGVPDFCSIYV